MVVAAELPTLATWKWVRKPACGKQAVPFHKSWRVVVIGYQLSVIGYQFSVIGIYMDIP